MPDPFGNPLPGEDPNMWRFGAGSYGSSPPTMPTGPSNPVSTGSHGTNTGQIGSGVNPWLQSAIGNTSNPNLNYSSYLTSLGFDVDEDKVGKFFSGISDQYGEDVGMARAGMSQNMQGLQGQATNQMMQLGGGQGLPSAYNPGFGRTQYGLNQAISNIGNQYTQGMQSGLLDFTQQKLGAQRDVQSQIRDVAMGLIGQDASGISWGNTNNNNNNNNFPTPPTDLPDWNPPPNPTGGGSSQYLFGGTNWIWDGGSWVTEAQYESDMADHYDTQP